MKGCRPLTDEEITLLSRSFGGTYAARDRALFILGLKSGFRISALLSLRVGEYSSMAASWIRSACDGQT
jgi:integrase